MKVLVACEESQEITKAFRSKGHEAYSCDIQECSGGHPEWHFKDDAIKVMNGHNWDLLIAHPPCTYLSRAGARWMFKGGEICKERYELALKAKQFFLSFYNSPIKLKAIENPTPLKIIGLPKYSQAIQPFEYGHPFSKRTLLWLSGLPFLKPTNIIKEYKPYLPSNTGGAKRGQKYTYVNISKKRLK